MMGEVGSAMLAKLLAREDLERWIIGGLLFFAFAGMTGGTWDAGWHVSFLRETFWTPPHLLLYAATAGSLFLSLAGLQLGRIRHRAIPLGFAIAALGAFVVIEAAPLDEFWHRTFGRDVDVWSFPHLVALAGGMAISVGSVMTVDARRRQLQGQDFGHRLVMALFLSVLLWATMFCLNWYTLVLAPFRESVKYPILASLVATPALVFATARLGRGGATAASAVYMGWTAAAHGIMHGFGMALLPFPPMLIVPAIAIDLVYWSLPCTGWRRAALTGAFFAPLFYLAEAASLAWYPHEQIKGVPTDRLALSYYLEALARPWDLAHVAVGLPVAMLVGAITAQLGAWLGEIRATTLDRGSRVFRLLSRLVPARPRRRREAGA
jgi:hypothetical protein